MSPTGFQRLLKKYPATFIRTIVPVAIVVQGFAIAQHVLVLEIPFQDIRPFMLVIPLLVGSLFGFMIGFIRAMTLEQRVYIDEIAAHEDALEEEIAEHRRAAEREQRLAFALDGASDGMWDWNIATGEVYYSPRWIEMLGYRPEDVPRNYSFWAERIHPDDVAGVIENLQDHLQGKTDAFVKEFRFRGGDGDWLWVLGRGKVVERDAQGNPLRAVGTQTDVTERRRIQAAVEGLMQGTARAVGEDFFPQLVTQLAAVLETRCAVIGEFREAPDLRLVTLAAWPAELFEAAPEIPVADTPCVVPAAGSVAVIRSDAVASYPRDPLLAQLQAESYIGLPLVGEDGQSVGILAVLDDRPLPEWKETLARNVLPIFGARATAEIERRSAGEALRAEQDRAQVTLASIGDGVITTDAQGRVDFMNGMAYALTGWRASEAVGESFASVCPLLDDENGRYIPDAVLECLRAGGNFDYPSPLILTGRGVRQPTVELSVAPLRAQEGEVLGTVVVLRDVSHTHEMVRQMSWQAMHDVLTGLVNRKEFERQLQESIAHSAEHRGSSALLYLDLDQFKVVNDTCGHSAGDELLRLLARLLQTQIRQSDTLARLGGDEFGVILLGCDVGQATEIADKLTRAIRDFRFAWEGKFFDVGVSIGIVMIDAQTVSAANALSAADIACYAAKDLGRNRSHLYQPDDAELARRQGEMQWVSRIRQALVDNRFALCCQPIKGVRTDTCVMHEILVRMLDEQGGLIPPGSFIPAAERYGLMSDVDRWVIEQVFSILGAGKNGLRSVALNLSALSLTRQGMSGFIADCQERYGVDPGRVCFEVTETAAIANLSHAIAFIADLRGRGFRFALDDFGSGLSSFTYLKNLPVDYLKIDGSFVRDMRTDAIDRAMVHAINEIGHTMGIQTIAEYVEDAETLAVLHTIGVDFAQGYHIAKPVLLSDDCVCDSRSAPSAS